jgi:hypothetical protein
MYYTGRLRDDFMGFCKMLEHDKLKLFNLVFRMTFGYYISR